MFSESLRRHIDIPIEYLNRVDVAELSAALAAIPGYPDCTPDQIRRLAQDGDINAAHVLTTAAGDGDAALMAREWI